MKNFFILCLAGGIISGCAEEEVNERCAPPKHVNGLKTGVLYDLPVANDCAPSTTPVTFVSPDDQYPQVGNGNDVDPGDSEDGNDGTDGVDGNDGSDGEDGNDGTDGVDGNDGNDGGDGNEGNNGGSGGGASAGAGSNGSGGSGGGASAGIGANAGGLCGTRASPRCDGRRHRWQTQRRRSPVTSPHR